MEGGEERATNKGLRKRRKGKLTKENPTTDTEDANASSGDEAMLGETLSLDSIRSVIKCSMTEAMSELENNISKQFSDLQHNFKEDIFKQLGEMRSEINQKMEETSEKIAATSVRLDEVEERIGEVETCSGEARQVLTQMQKTQLAMQSKITELEGHSRRNNIRIYGIREGAEGTSMTNFVTNLIKTNLEADNASDMSDLSIERAYRASGAKPPEAAAPRSTVVRFARYTTKEKVLSAAWKKPITVDGKRIYFDHDYATGVMEKRREYLPIKKILKEKGIRFHTPLTKMRVFLDSGTITYDSADQAAKDLRARGFPVPPRAGSAPGDPPQLSPGWKTVGNVQRGENYQQRIRDKLDKFQRATGMEAE